MEVYKMGLKDQKLLARYLKINSLSISENTVKAIFKRNHVKVTRKISANGKNRRLYDY